MSRRKPDQQGFTILELLIASSVFSVILLLSAAVIVKIGQIYYRGIIAGRTQEVTRSVMDEMTRSLQFNGGKVTTLTPLSGGPGGTKAYGFCIDNRRYSYVIDRQLTDDTSPSLSQSPHVLVTDDNPPGGCVTTNTPQALWSAPLSGSRELLVDHMRLGTDPMPVLVGTKSYTVNLMVVYGDEELFATTKTAVIPATVPVTYNYYCPSNNQGGQFCSISQLTTTIQKRVQ